MDFVLILHLIGAIGMGFYLLLPFTIGRLTKLSSEGTLGFGQLLVQLNVIGQFLLVLMLVTGVILILGGGYHWGWVVGSLILLLAIGAFAGIMGKTIRQLMVADGASKGRLISKITKLSWLVFATFLITVLAMQFPN